MPKWLIISCYPLLLIGAAVAVWQTRKLANRFPSKAWATKARTMTFFAALNIYGVTYSLLTARNYTWLGAIYLVGLVIFISGLLRFNHRLYKDEKALKKFAQKYLKRDGTKTVL
jgi:peptidoglycan/LPS O-acetylase OafA/YrhL